MTEAQPKRRRFLRSAAINGTVLLFSFVAAACAAEVAVRVAAPQQLILIRPDLWQPADTVGWLHRPNVHTTINTGERTVSVHTDSAGFRVGSAGPSTGIPVLVLGDSFMEALQVEYESSFPGLLEAALSRQTGRDIAIRNAGVGGWNPSQYLLRARSLVAAEEYRLVVASVYIGNDILAEPQDYIAPRLPVERHHFRLPRRLSRAELVNSFLRPLNDMLEVRSHLFILLRSGLESFRMRLGLYPLVFPSDFNRTHLESGRWDSTADVLEQISNVAVARGAEAVFLLIPAPFQVDEASFASYARGFGLDTAAVDLEQPNRRLSEAMSARGLRFIDVLPAFRQAHASGVQLYGAVDPHLSPEGHDVLVDIVTPLVSDLLEEPRDEVQETRVNAES